MATPERYHDVHELLLSQNYSVQGIVDALSMSRVTVTKILRSSPHIEEHLTWPRTYSIKGDSTYRKPRKEVSKILSDEEIENAKQYLEILLKPETSIDIAMQFQAVDSVEGADFLIKALNDCVKVAQYYKTVLAE